MTDEAKFNISLENIEYPKDYTYLLNFWYTSKLNKENEFIKRNGLHPSIYNVSQYNKNELKVREGNSIPTNFYTVFKIFIENIFKETKAAKTRDTEEWTMGLKPGAQALDLPHYLLLNYARAQNIQSQLISFPVIRRTTIPASLVSFKIRISNKDELHCKKLVSELETFETHAKVNIDLKVTEELIPFMDKLSRLIAIPEVSVKAAKKKAEVSEPRLGTHNPMINELLPVYNNLNTSLTAFPPRTRFSYILSFAKQAGTNALISTIEDTEANYNAFLALTNNMAA